ncbi:MAG TPA: SRPBCC family protein [Acidimicrobiales bacterium]|nr:SRPBCC family protein [Acidimicrobiales bacterium]
MIVGEASATVAVSPAEVLEFVLDLERYRRADHKIGRVGPVKRNGSVGTAVFSGRIKGMPGPSGTYPFTLTPTSLKFGSPIAGPARWFLTFEGSFECEETGDGTVVIHREVFDFKRPWRWFVEPFLHRWLENDTGQEMVRFKDLVEGGTTPGS